MKRWGGKSFSRAEGGGTTIFGVVFKRQLEVLAILNGGGGAKSFHPKGNVKHFTLS